MKSATVVVGGEVNSSGGRGEVKSTGMVVDRRWRQQAWWNRGSRGSLDRSGGSDRRGFNHPKRWRKSGFAASTIPGVSQYSEHKTE